MHEPSDDRNVEEADPDYRFTPAHERTCLSWIRTALGLLAGDRAVVLPAGGVAAMAGSEMIAILLS